MVSTGETPEYAVLTSVNRMKPSIIHTEIVQGVTADPECRSRGATRRAKAIDKSFVTLKQSTPCLGIDNT